MFLSVADFYTGCYRCGEAGNPDNLAASNMSNHYFRPGPRLAVALYAGAVAITINMLLLKAADIVAVQTAHGGLLRVISPLAARLLEPAGVSAWWRAVGGPGIGTAVFQDSFHFVVGIGMALAYVLLLEPRLSGAFWRKGLLYALVVWLLNAFVILPLSDEGIAGSAHLVLAGMLWFAAAHTAFFVLLAGGVELLLSRK
jgi:hypothetical protein